MRVRWTSRTMLFIVSVALVASACGTSVAIDSPQSAQQSSPEPQATQPPEPTAQPAAQPPEETAAVPTPVPPPAATPTEVPEQSSEPRSVSSIRDIDFVDGFEYETFLGFGSDTAVVTDGIYQNGEFGDEDFYWFSATDIEFGDLDRDGVEEAVLITTWNGGGTGYFDSVRVYRLVDGSAERAGMVGFGDRSDGGVHDVRIVDGTVRVWTFTNGQGACCPTEIAEVTLALGDHALVEIGQTPARTWVPLGDFRSAGELKFLPGTSSALLTVYGMDIEGSADFEASAGQHLSLVHTSGPEPLSVTLIDLTTGDPVLDPQDVVLASSGLYGIAVTFAQERDELTMFELAIDGGEPSPAIGWQVMIDQVLLDDDPFVHTSVAWPVFESDQPGTDAVNELLGAFAAGLDDWWVDDVTRFEDPQDTSSYEATFDVTLATNDLVSVRFDYLEYVCCRPYPNYGFRSLVLDLLAGRIIPIEEIIDASRIGELNALWFAELERQELLPADSIIEGEDVVRFDSLSLTATGLEFGTDRGSLGGGLPGTTVVVPFDTLGDIMNPEIAARAAG